MRRFTLFLFAPFYSLLLAATPVSTSSSREVAPTAITRLLLRDYEILISMGTEGTARYDIYSQSGQVLETGLSDEQLQANYPAVYDQLQPAVADSDSGSDSGLIMMMWEKPI